MVKTDQEKNTLGEVTENTSQTEVSFTNVKGETLRAKGLSEKCIITLAKYATISLIAINTLKIINNLTNFRQQETQRVIAQ